MGFQTKAGFDAVVNWLNDTALADPKLQTLPGQTYTIPNWLSDNMYFAVFPKGESGAVLPPPDTLWHFVTETDAQGNPSARMQRAPWSRLCNSRHVLCHETGLELPNPLGDYSNVLAPGVLDDYIWAD